MWSSLRKITYSLFYAWNTVVRLLAYAKSDGFQAFAHLLLHRLRHGRQSSIELAVVDRFPDGYDFRALADLTFLNLDHYRNIFLLTDGKHRVKGLPPHVSSIFSISELTKEEIVQSIFFIAFESDEEALTSVASVVDKGGRFVPLPYASKTPYRFTNDSCIKALVKTSRDADRISHFGIEIHENLCEALDITRKLSGDVVEFGVYLGGSALTILNYLRELQIQDSALSTKVWLFDSFDGFSYAASRNSADAQWVGTHELGIPATVMRRVANTLKGANYPFRLVQMEVCVDSLPSEIKRIRVANIDVDLYEATAAALAKVSPLMELNGVIICEDATSTPRLYGARLAMNEFLQSSEGQKYVPIHKTTQYFLIKVRV